jgi:hypothetical protein
MINKSGSMPVTMSYNVMPETKYDAIYASGTFDVNVTKVSGSTQTIATQGSVDSIIAKLPSANIAGSTELASVASNVGDIKNVMPATVVASKSNTDLLATQSSLNTVTGKLPVTGLIAGNDLLQDVDDEIDAIKAQMPTTGQVADQASMEMILAVLPTDKIVGVSDLGAMTLADTVENYHVVINAIKTHNSTDATPVSGSIYQDILTPLSTINSQLPAGGAEIASGVQVEEVAQNQRYFGKNRMVKNGDGTMTYYQDDNTTPAYSVSHSETERMPL